MPDPIEIHRKEVVQRIQTLNAQGGWEGAHTDFKRELGSTTRDLGKLLKHVLAFSNTPRRTSSSALVRTKIRELSSTSVPPHRASHNPNGSTKSSTSTRTSKTS
jgi:hypothetical protein